MGFEINVVLENVLNTVLNKNTSNAAVFYQVSHIWTCAFTLNVLILDQLFLLVINVGKKLNDMKLTGASNVQFVVIFVVLGFEIENRNWNSMWVAQMRSFCWYLVK